jgi:hypothetical protein
MRRTAQDRVILAELFSRIPFSMMLSLTQPEIEQMLMQTKMARFKLKEATSGNTETKTQD